MRCINCKKKKGIQMDCKCGSKYCLECLPYWVHKCSFDYKERNKKELEKTNTTVSSAKVSDI